MAYRLYDVMAFNSADELTEPTGEYICAQTSEEAIEIAEGIAEDNGLKLHGFYVHGIEPTKFYYEEDDDGFALFDCEDDEYIGTIYSSAKTRKADKKRLDECNHDYDTALTKFEVDEYMGYEYELYKECSEQRTEWEKYH